MKVLVTGASGFVGGAVAARLAADGIQARAAVRRPDAPIPAGTERIQVADLTADTDWSSATRGVDVVVHAAARVHVMRDRAADPLTEFRRANVAGTLALARQAAASGVARFVFLSSIKVNGEETTRGRPYTADDPPAPVDPYGVSKHEAEQGLRALADDTGMEVVIIRPVLVYGPGVKGNFKTMLQLVRSGMPLPLAAVKNSRSLVAVENLVDLIVHLLEHPAAANRVLLVSDGEDLSTPDLLRRAAAAMGRPSRLVPVPTTLLLTLARMLGRRAVVQRLCGDLQVDVSATRALLDWTPPISVDEGLRRAVHVLPSSGG
jgi:nucleoside-diphosphate-sugar epimerase